ncbi:MAG: universal stress protein [Cellvibrionaceae bacterium]
MIKTILLAADLSVFTPCLLQHASELANQHSAKLVVVHAVEPLGNLGHALLNAYLKPETTHLMTTTGLDAMMDEVKAQVIDILTEEHLDGSVDLLQLGEVIVKAGPPVDVILTVAEDIKADLIILGSHSPALANTTSLGTVAQKVLNSANVPVYVVPHRPIDFQLPTNNTQMGLW